MTLLFSSFRPVNCEMSGCQNYLFRIAQLLNTDTDRLLLKKDLGLNLSKEYY